MTFYGDTDTIDILLVGKTGQGKSATGNNILGRNSFAVSNYVLSKTDKTDLEYSTFMGKPIKVVDTRGLMDTRHDLKMDIKKTVNDMSEAIAMSTNGYHCIIFVVRYGNRFTREDVKTVEILKQIFGDNFMREHGILLFTGGDSFAKEYQDEKEKITFKQWLAKQTEPNMQALIQECGYRTILFNNKCKTIEEKESQLKELMELINRLNKKGERYTNKTFEKANKQRNTLLANLRRPFLKDEQYKQISLITKKLGDLKLTQNNFDEQYKNLQDLQKEANVLYNELIETDSEQKFLKVGITKVQQLQEIIENQIKRMGSLIEERQALDRQRERKLQKGKLKEKRMQSKKHEIEVKEHLEEHQSQLQTPQSSAESNDNTEVNDLQLKLQGSTETEEMLSLAEREHMKKIQEAAYQQKKGSMDAEKIYQALRSKVKPCVLEELTSMLKSHLLKSHLKNHNDY